MSRRIARSFTGMFLVGLLLSTVLATAALAAQAAGPWTYYSGYNESYRAQNIMVKSTSGHKSGHTAVEGLSGTFPAGYAGVLPRVYNDSGTLCAAGTASYNSVATNWHERLVTGSCSGAFYSRGYSKAWTGSTYQNYFPGRAPSLS